jgi:hypothetical protein
VGETLLRRGIGGGQTALARVEINDNQEGKVVECPKPHGIQCDPERRCVLLAGQSTVKRRLDTTRWMLSAVQSNAGVAGSAITSASSCVSR